MSALTGLKRKNEAEASTEGFYAMYRAEGYNQALDDLEEYELCEDDLAHIIAVSMLRNQGGRPAIDTGRIHAKAILENTSIWIKRKDVK